MPKAVVFLSAENHIESELAEIGSHYSAARLGTGGKTILGYAKADDATLAGFGFGAGWRAAMSAAIKELATSKNVRVAKESAARPSGAKAAGSFADCEAFVKHARAVLAALPHAASSQAPATPHNGERPATIATTRPSGKRKGAGKAKAGAGTTSGAASQAT